MTGCSAKGCKNRSEKGYLMKKIPADPVRRAQWVAQINRKGWTPTKSSYLCEAHFEPHMWEKTRQDGTRVLKCSAVPTVFGLNKLKNYQITEKKKFSPTILKKGSTETQNDVQIDVNKSPNPAVAHRDHNYFSKLTKAETETGQVCNEITDLEDDINKIDEEIKKIVKETQLTLHKDRFSEDTKEMGKVGNSEEIEELEEIGEIEKLDEMDSDHDESRNTFNMSTDSNDDSPPASPSEPATGKKERFIFSSSSASTPEEQIAMYEEAMLKQERVISALRRKIKVISSQKSKMRKSLLNPPGVLQSFLDEDQIRALSKKNKKNAIWSADTLQKALRIRSFCGTRGYKELLRQGFPFPSLRTLQRKAKLMGLSFETIFEKRKNAEKNDEDVEVSSTTENERHLMLFAGDLF